MPDLTPAPLETPPVNGTTGIFRHPWAIWLEILRQKVRNASLIEVFFDGLNDKVFFLANGSYQVVDVREIHSSADSGTPTVDVIKDSNSESPASGSSVLSTPLGLNTVANTSQAGSLTTTVANQKLVAGDRLSTKFSGTLATVAGVKLSVRLKAI